MRNRLTMALAAALLISGCTQPEVETGPPNIIFLLTDDHRWDALGAAGNTLIQTPNMDDLANQGVRFRNAYVTTSICPTSRSSIMSGQYASKHGIHGFRNHFSDDAFQYTYPQMLRQSGYFTGFVGKYGISQSTFEEEFDFWRGFAGQGKYEMTDSTGAYLHLTRKMGDDALAFLDEIPTDQPFNLSISFKAPHVQDSDPRQFLYDRTLEDLYSENTIPHPVTGDTSYYRAFPDFFTEVNEGRRRWGMRFKTPEMYQTSVKGYYRLITGVDRVIGDLRKKLAEIGEAENTVFILIGDNGFYLGEHGLAGKWYGHEESIRVPFIVYDPRVDDNRKGQTPDEIVLNIDVAPTILELAGLDKPSSMQGESVIALTDGSNPTWRQDFFYEHRFEHPGIPKSEGVVSVSEKYLRYYEQDPVYEELYDLEADSVEVNNLANKDEERLNQARARFEQLKAEAEGR